MSQKFLAADGLRGLACLWVVCTHALVIIITDISPRFIGVPKIGVWLFFVLSAFLLTYKFSRSGFSVPILSQYFVGRIIRILPLYFIFVIFYWLFGTANINDINDVRKSVLMSGAYAHLWTVPVEFKYYLLLPAISWVLIATNQRFGMTVALLSGLALLVLQQLVWPYWLSPRVTTETRWYLSCFTAGSIAAVCIDSLRLKISPNIRLFVCFFLGFAILLSAFLMIFRVFSGLESTYLVDKFLYFSIAFAGLVLVCVDGQGVAGGLIKNKYISAVGRWSFSIYLGHWFIVMKLSHYFEGSYIAACLSVALSLLAGYLIYAYIEVPIERFRHRVTSR